MLSAFGYPYPPLYEGRDFMEGGVHRCSVTLTIPQHPLNVEWALIVIQVVGHCLLDSWEMVAMRGIIAFCKAHPMEVVLTPFGLFPAHNKSNLQWQNGMDQVQVVADFPFDLDDANTQLHQQKHALHFHPTRCRWTMRRSPRRWGGSDVDFEEHAPQPTLIAPHSPIESEASVHN
jgi:hypothetical protein